MSYIKKGKMQTKQTARLARKIRRIRERKKRGRLTFWRVVCERLNILTDDGRADPGLAHKIGYGDYEPSNRELRVRLGLTDICSKCRRTFRVPRKAAAPRTLTPARAWWEKLNREEQDKVIELSYKNYIDWKKSHSTG